MSKLKYLRLRPFDVSTEEGRNQERYRRIVLTTFTTLATKGISTSTMLISVPLTVNYLGKERYGLWMAISSLILSFGFVDLGIGSGLVNGVAEATGKDDFDELKTSVATSFYTLLFISLIAGLIFFVVSPWISWTRVFNISTALSATEASFAIKIFFVITLVNIPLDIVNRVQIGSQKGYISNLWQLSGSLMGFVGILFGVHFQVGLPTLITAAAGGPVLATLGNFLHTFVFRNPELFPSRANFRRDKIRGILASGSSFTLLYLISVLGFTADSFVVAHFVGAASVATFSVVQRMFSAVYLFQAYLTPMWPATSEALARGNYVWVAQLLKRSLGLTLGLATLIGGIFFLGGKTIIHHWIGPAINPPFMLLGGYFAWTLASSYGGAISMVMNSRNYLRLQIIFSGSAALLGFGLKVLLSRRIGEAGIVWGSVIGYSICFVAPTLWLVAGVFESETFNSLTKKNQEFMLAALLHPSTEREIFMQGSVETPFCKFRKNVYSQNGEDGVIEEIVKRLDFSSLGRPSWCVEFGAWDGKHLSNTFNLVENKGWKAVFIEGDKQRFNDLVATSQKHPSITPVNAFVARTSQEEHSLDKLLARTAIPKDFELLSIDIDSYDLCVWESLTHYQPKIIVIEIDSSLAPGIFLRHSAKCSGNSFSSTAAVAKSKGYQLVIHTGNMIFVRNDLFPKIKLEQRFQDFPELLFDHSWLTSNHTIPASIPRKIARFGKNVVKTVIGAAPDQ